MRLPEQPALSDLAGELRVTRGAFDSALRQQGRFAGLSEDRAERVRGAIDRVHG